MIEGAKWCGKTTSAKHIAKSFIEMDRLDMTDQYQQMARINPANLLEGDVPHLIDEWQIATNIWNAVRYEVDQRGEFGQFILTGSSVPVDLDESMHTGTGRIVRMRMRPMSLFESLDSNGQVSLNDLFDRMYMCEKHINRFINGEVQLTLEIAVRLEMVLGVPAKFWNNLEVIYREKIIKAEAENVMDADADYGNVGSNR